MGYIDSWILFSKNLSGVVCIPLGLLGAMQLFMGHRLGRVGLAISFAGIGAAYGFLLQPSVEIPALWLPGIAVGLALGFLLPERYRIASMGGAMVAAFAMAVLEPYGLSPTVQSLAIAIITIGAVAVSQIHQDEVRILVSSLEGAILLVTVMFAFGATLPDLLGSLCKFIEGSAILLPFAVAVPTVVGCALQAAGKNIKDRGFSRSN